MSNLLLFSVFLLIPTFFLTYYTVETISPGSLVNYFKKNYNNVFLIILFVFCLFPFSFMTKTGAVSANYLFVLIPLTYILYTREILLPKIDITIYILFYFLLFLISSIMQFENWALFSRRFISFVIFLSIFLLAFIYIKKKIINYFLLSFLLLGIILASYSIWSYFYHQYNEIQLAAKGAMGTSRYGFSYLFNFWILIFYKFKTNNLKLFLFTKYSLLLLMVIGCFLTFSRSSTLCLYISFFMYFCVLTFKIVKNSSTKTIIKHFFLTIIITIFLFFLLYYFFYWSLFFSFDRLILNFFSKYGTDVFNLENYNTSEGYRYHILLIIIEFLKYNLITGSGFLGMWTYPDHFQLYNFVDHFVGSAHSQYFDILFRTSYLGLLLYLIMLFRLHTYFYKYNKGIFWGLLTVSIFGLFHETFKLSYGAFLLCILINIYSNDIYGKEEN